MDSPSIESGLAALAIDAPPGAAELLGRYLELILKWNKVHNLTAITDPQRMVVEHLLDSLSVGPLLVGERILDVGSGAGLPGIPLAAVSPQRRFTLLDASSKRCAFLRQAAIELPLRNVEVVCARVEQFRPATAYATILSRAFAETSAFARAALRLLDDDGIMIAMKGIHPESELASLPAGVAVREVVQLQVPGLRAQRHAVVMTKA